MSKKNRVTESQIQNAVCDYLAINRFFFWRQNTIPVYDPVRKAFRRMPKYSMNGVSDIIWIYRGAAIFIEVKTPKGKLSESQKEFKTRIEEEGGYYFIVRNFEDIEEVVRVIKIIFATIPERKVLLKGGHVISTQEEEEDDSL
jgi:hypothetical protein